MGLLQLCFVLLVIGTLVNDERLAHEIQELSHWVITSASGLKVKSYKNFIFIQNRDDPCPNNRDIVQKHR